MFEASVESVTNTEYFWAGETLFAASDLKWPACVVLVQAGHFLRMMKLQVCPAEWAFLFGVGLFG